MTRKESLITSKQADALEHLTEESAKEIFRDSETISVSTSKVIATFVDKISTDSSENNCSNEKTDFSNKLSDTHAAGVLFDEESEDR